MKVLLVLLEILDVKGHATRPLVQRLASSLNGLLDLGFRYACCNRGVYSARLDFAIGRSVAVGFVGECRVWIQRSGGRSASELQYGLLDDGRQALDILRQRYPALSHSVRIKLTNGEELSSQDRAKLGAANRAQAIGSTVPTAPS